LPGNPLRGAPNRPDSRDPVLDRLSSTGCGDENPMFMTTGAIGIAIRRITAAVSWALLLQLSMVSAFGAASICDDARAHAGHSVTSSMSALDHHQGSPSDPARQGYSCTATLGANCPMQSGNTSNCSTMTSCATVVAALTAPVPDENLVPAGHIAAGRLVSPRAWVTAPDHPPPRA